MMRHNLPVQSTPFIGRADELAALDSYLADPAVRLITITGPGGMGKTRLAIACAERQVAGPSLSVEASATPDFPQGVFFVPLAPVHESEQIVDALAEALAFPIQAGDREQRPPRQQLLDYLREKQMLLILDNFEHLLAGVDLVRDILHTAVAVKILTTSRERLHLPEEQVYPIQGLAYPQWEGSADARTYTAVQLFSQSAKRNDPRFTITSEEMSHLARICRLVQGMPLGIELAASWVDMLALPEIAAEIQKSLDFLEAENRHQTDRHRSMRAVFDYSWQLLDAEERELLPQLSVFRGGFSREAAQVVANASLRALARLANKSLLQFDKGNGRYQMHELLRQYAVEKLAAAEAETAVYQRHALYYAQLLADREPQLRGAESEQAAEEIEGAIDNLRAAWRWLLHHRRAADLLPAMNGLGYYLLVHNQYQLGFELYQQVQQVYESPATPLEKRLWVRAVNWHTFLLLDITVGNKEYAPALSQALIILKELQQTGEAVDMDRAFTCYLLGACLSPGVHYSDESIHYVQIAHDLYQKAGFAWGLVQTLSWLSWSIFFRGNTGNGYLTAQEMDAEALRMAQATGNRWLKQVTLSGVCMRAIQAGDLAVITRHLDELTQEIESLRANRYRAQLGEHLRFQAMFLLHSGFPEGAYGAFHDALTIYQELGQPVDEFFQLNLGSFSMHCGSYAEAAAHLQQGLTLSQQHDNSWGIGYGQILFSMYELANGRLAEAEQRLVRFLSAAEQAPDAIPGDIAGIRANLALALCRQSRWSEALPYLFKSLQTVAAGRYYLPLIELLPGLCATLAHQGHQARALELYGALLARPYYANSVLFQDMSGHFLRSMAESLPPALVQTAVAHGETLDVWALAEALLDELAALGWDQPAAAATGTAVAAMPAAPEPVLRPLPTDQVPTDQVPTGQVPTGQPLERFQQEELLATGGHGEVYRGRETTTGQQVVIKRLKQEVAVNQPEMVERFLREAEVLRQLDHPNIVKMLAAQETDTGHIIVMEYVPGGTLAELLAKEGQLSISRTVDIALELADALARAHHLGVVHRDIKPANVLLAVDGTPRLTDFGVASLTQTDKRLTQTGVILGTIDYLSPEACEGKPLDARSDIWSFGALLYEMLAGDPPFSGDSLLITLMAILTRPTPDVQEKRPSTPTKLKTLIDQMLVKDIQQRLASMRRVAAELEDIRRQL
ncbi:MAG: protein kinase [Ardenticatenaceae bacterium]|nr:protein kinase [Ardenticatenaceae bacterium]